MIFSNHALSQRLEAAEGFACAQFAIARKRLFPHCDSATMHSAGATVVFDGVDAPTTQTFGLGLFEPLTSESLDPIEQFFLTRSATPMHEVSPFAGVATLDLLCARNYRPFEISSVLFRPVENPSPNTDTNIKVRIVEQGEAELWGTISARGWTHEHPELADFVRDAGVLCVARDHSPCFLAEIDGQPAAAGALSIHKGVALFGGAATVPEHRQRGLQAALLEARMAHAFANGCDLAMICAEAGSNSQRNAERKGFRVAYTRLKWQLVKPGDHKSF